MLTKPGVIAGTFGLKASLLLPYTFEIGKRGNFPVLAFALRLLPS